MTAYVDKFKVVVAQNEALAQVFDLTVDDGAGNQVPLDLTGITFHAQVRKKRSVAAELLADLEVVITDALAGTIELRLDVALVGQIPPGTYYYDILMEIDGGEPDNLWSAPFVVEPGVTVWPSA